MTVDTTSGKRMGVKDMDDGSRTIVCKNGGNDTLGALRQLRQDRTLCDIIIKVQEGEILAHRVILVINSPYYRAMFTEGFTEMHTHEVELMADDLDFDSASALIDFMYTGSLTVTADNVQGLIMTANLWQMTDVKKMCEDYMERLIDAHNCLGIGQFAELYDCERLVQRSEQLLKQRFPLVVQGPEFLLQSPESLLRILSFPNLSLGHEGEDVVVKALFRWLDHKQDLPTEDLLPLVRTVHWAATSPLCRYHLLNDNPIVSSNEELRQLIEALAEDKTLAGRQAQTTLYVIGGFLQSRTGPKCPRLKSVERLDTVTSRWTPCADLPMLSLAAVAFNLHGHLFCCACEPIPHQNNIVVMQTSVFEYKIMRDEWNSAEDNFSVEVVDHIDGCLQAEGAMTVCPQTNTIYLVSRSEVAFIPVTVIEGEAFCRDVRLLPRPTAYFTEQQRNHGALVEGGRLYVLGGDRHDGGTDPVPTARVIAFDFQQKQWVSCANMLEPRVKPAVAALNGKIYASGGFGVRRLATMECYDPATDQWTALQSMNKYRSHHQMLVLHNTLWAIGGKSYAVKDGGARKVLNTCEVYDPDTDTWTETEEQNMKHARCSFAAVAI